MAITSMVKSGWRMNGVLTRDLLHPADRECRSAPGLKTEFPPNMKLSTGIIQFQ